MTEQHFPEANYTPADTAFEPHSEFDFAEGSEAFHAFPSYSQLGDHRFGAMSGPVVQNAQNHAGFFGAGHFPVGSSSLAPGNSVLADINPSHVWGISNSSIDTPHMHPDSSNNVPCSTQNDIIESRRDTAAERHGQVTPPEDTSAPDFRPRHDSGPGDPSKTSKPAKMDKSQRARNAAVSRHSKAKLQRALNAESNVESGSPGVEDKKERYREKNRQAAAKCRQKKKENTDDLESKHRTLSAHNSFLKNEVRQLRGQLVELRLQALPHHDSDPRCKCTGLHHFNRAQAKRLTETATLGQLGLVNSPTTLSEGHDSTAPSPRATSDRMNSLPRVPSSLTGLPPRPASFAAPSDFGFGQSTAPEPMEDCRRTAGSIDNSMLFFGHIHGSSGEKFSGLRSSPIDSQHEYDGLHPSPGAETNGYAVFQPPAGNGCERR
ncbi:Basic region leucine zipper [Teratosphaeria destructans]|uniref:Basic region leucine zipper n=1 Tax=Teratosphaeria destructans TaxID=418781 RepID=A0A9W7SZB6_9PEZI|nr:Basic region leucine zipper [Teratosphaeria destructans]